ncbi:FAS1-like dehydratase domain-containing protein [Psychromicrobium lacuslunae]|uniref:Acyl dehydratase n=1 Tax=Psychromicrobium lacuslunae TaxID=1618207 RepID=A0A0D4BZF5_9MICC|nr:MaoC family dehydratase N-terminal domain-containing protein [Psychromicrobium lacuslunae]AJT41694.1 acyl dehydratase [Psychromicrobium lacuslunae]
MTVPAELIGRQLPVIETTVSAERLRFFAEAIAERDPIYLHAEAAAEAGHSGLPLPPTILFGLEFEGPAGFDWLTEMGVDVRRVLHGEQEFHYHAMAYAGEALRLVPTIVDVYSKKGGALDFLVKETKITRISDGSAVATAKSVIVVNNQEAVK